MYFPCDMSIHARGIAAEIPPVEDCDDAGPLIVIHDLPFTRMRALRRSGAEVWPGAWQDAHVGIVEV
jgi:hypothetical protein